MPASLSASGRRKLGLTALIVLFAVEATIVVGAAGPSRAVVPAVRSGRPGWLVGPLDQLSWWTMGPGHFRAAYAAMFVAYLVILACGAALRSRWLLWGSISAQLLMLLSPPLLSSDLFGYVTFGRLGAVYGLNPYAVPPAAVPSNPLLHLHAWHHLPTPYGPLFTVFSYPIAAVGVVGGYWLMKTAIVAAAVACVALVWRIATLRGLDAGRAVAFVALNPVWLVTAVGGFHNDMLMIALVLTGLLFLTRGRDSAGIGSTVLAVGVKFAALTVLPFAVLGARKRGQAVVAALVTGLALAIGSLIVFGGALTNSLTVAGDTATRYGSRFSGPAALGRLLGYSSPTSAIDFVLGVGAGIVVLIMLVRAWRGADWVAAAGWATLATLAAATFLGQWYFTWVLPLAALGFSRRLRAAALVATALLVAQPQLDLARGGLLF